MHSDYFSAYTLAMPIILGIVVALEIVTIVFAERAKMASQISQQKTAPIEMENQNENGTSKDRIFTI